MMCFVCMFCVVGEGQKRGQTGCQWWSPTCCLSCTALRQRYGTMIQDAVEPSWHQPLTNQALLLRSASSTPTPAAIPGAPAFGRSPSMAMSVASTAAYVGALGMGVGAAASPISRLGFAASPAPSACHTPGPVKVPAGLEGGGLMLTPGRQVAGAQREGGVIAPNFSTGRSQS